MEKTTFSGAVLAGGRSKRMGTDKASVRINGRSLLDMQLDKLNAAGVQELLVSDAAGSKRDIPYGARQVPDILPGKGPLCGIASALYASSSEFCVILSVDAAGVTPDTVKKLMDAAENSAAEIVVLASESGLQPLIGVYKCSLAEDALALVKSGRPAVRELFKEHAPLLLNVPDDSTELLNCNTPKDLEKLASHMV